MHTSRRAQVFEQHQHQHYYQLVVSPFPESPDLNPIENLWHDLKFYLESKVKPRNKQELVDGINLYNYLFYFLCAK